jgi:hypothetical protein
LYKKLLHKSEFGQAHCEEWFKKTPTNFILYFWTLVQVSMNFGSLKQFMQFKTIENELKFAAQCRAGIRPVATVRGVATYHAWPNGRPARPRPGGTVQLVQ